MRKLIFCFVAIFYAFACYAQSSIKLGASYRYSSNDGYTSQFQLDIPAYFSLLPNDLYIEAGVDAFRLSKRKTEGNLAATTFAADFSPYFEYGLLTGSAMQKMRFKLGARAVLNTGFQSYVPNTTIDFRNRYFTSGLGLAIVPGAFYKVKEKLYFNLSVPFNLYSGAYQIMRVDNPAIPIRQQRSHGWVNDFFPAVYQVEAGVIYQLFR